MRPPSGSTLSQTSTFQAPSRVARRRCLDAHSSKGSALSCATLAAAADVASSEADDIWKSEPNFRGERRWGSAGQKCNQTSEDLGLQGAMEESLSATVASGGAVFPVSRSSNTERWTGVPRSTVDDKRFLFMLRVSDFARTFTGNVFLKP